MRRVLISAIIALLPLIQAVAQTDSVAVSSASAIDYILPHYQPLSRMLSTSRVRIPTLGNSLEIMRGMRKFDMIYNDIANAQESVHFEYYEFSLDREPLAIRNLLMARAEDGIDVRVLAENLVNLPVNYTSMRSSGVQVRLFTPVLRPLRFLFQINHRNHQKIAVIDSKIGYIGGMNMAENYFRNWRDTDLRIYGPAATIGVDGVFWRMWEGSGIHSGPAFADTVSYPMVTDPGKIVQVIGEGPFDGELLMEKSYEWMMDNSLEYFYAKTPYFAPPKTVLRAMGRAARRGADVRIIVPGVSDVPVMDPMNRYFLARCVNMGVKVYLSRGAFNHSKTFVSDDYLTGIGSVNMDNRSFRLNYEDNAFIYDEDVARQMKDEFIYDCENVCDPLTREDIGRWPASQRILQAILYLISPLL